MAHYPILGTFGAWCPVNAKDWDILGQWCDLVCQDGSGGTLSCPGIVDADWWGMKPPTLETLKAAVKAAGYTPSTGSWENEDGIYAYSVQSAHGTYGHPAFECQYNRATGWVTIGSQQIKVQS